MNSNGKTKWLLWAAGIIFTIVLTTIVALANCVIENDRIRASEDTRIETKVEVQYTDIIQRLSRIEAKLEK